MLFESEFYRQADKLREELLALGEKHPSLLAYKWSNGRVRSANIWFIGLTFTEAIDYASATLWGLRMAMMNAGSAFERLAEAMDRSNLDDSSTSGTSIYSGPPASPSHIYRTARAVQEKMARGLRDIYLEISVSPLASPRLSLFLRVAFVALLIVLLVIFLPIIFGAGR